MQVKGLRWYAVAAAFTLALAASLAGFSAEEKIAARECSFEVRIYQVLTNVTGSGLISRTLPGMNGWLQIVHQKLDDVELVMDGPNLTWDGQSAPVHPRIIGIAAPKVMTLEGERANIAVGSKGPLQYMSRNQDGLFELKTADMDGIGLSLAVKPVGFSGGNLLNCDLSFRYAWVKEREKIEGVNLEVGQPIIGRVSTEGAVQMRLGEWSCYQTPVESEGSIFLFVRAEEKGRETIQEEAKGPGQSPSTKEIRDNKAAKATPKGGGLKIEVGGSTEIRGSYRTGGH